MDGDSLCCLVIFIVFVIFGGYFAGCESCFSAMNRIRIKSLADNGDRHAKKALYVSNNFDRALTTLLIGNNITHIAAAAVATLFVTLNFKGDAMTDSLTVASTFITTGIVFLFSEMIPKSFANDKPDSMSLAMAGSLIVLMKIFSPLVAFFGAISNFFSKLFKKDEDPSITEDELYDIIDIAEEQEVIDDEQSDLLRSVLDFTETRARDVMTVREDIVSLDVKLSNAEIIEKIRDIPHSRIIMTDGSIDNVVGILPVRRFIRAYMQNPKTDKRFCLLKPHFVNADDVIDDLLDSMRNQKIYLAIVKEKDRVVGLVTIEDFLEELVGEIWDEEDEVDTDFYKMGGGRYCANARLKVSDFFERIGRPINDPKIASYTLGFWVTYVIGHLPEEGESITYDGIEIEVEKVSKTRILTLIATVPSDAPEEEAQK